METPRRGAQLEMSLFREGVEEGSSRMGAFLGQGSAAPPQLLSEEGATWAVEALIARGPQRSDLTAASQSPRGPSLGRRHQGRAVADQATYRPSRCVRDTRCLGPARGGTSASWSTGACARHAGVTRCTRTPPRNRSDTGSNAHGATRGSRRGCAAHRCA